MSTILDALRKLEEERQSRTADARSRLLLTSAHQTQPLRWQRPSWRSHTTLIGIVSFTLAGFAAGGGVVLWQSYSSSAQSEHSSAVVPPNTVHDTHIPTAANRQPREQSPSEVTTIASSQLTPSPVEARATSPQSLPPKQENADAINTATAGEEESEPLTSASAVQRSPFIASPPIVRDAAPRSSGLPSSTPPPSRRQQTAVPPSPAIPPPSQHATPKAPSTTSTPWDQYVQKSQRQMKGETTGDLPAGTSLSFLQWSSDPERRIAFLRVNGGPLTMAHEGDTIGEYTVVEIRQNAVELQSGETKMTLRTP